MLRLLLLALILANGAYFAWSQGLLRAYGWAPAQQSEPQRLTQQTKPEALRVLSGAEFKAIEAQMKADMHPKECLQAGPFDAAQTTTLRRALESGWPVGTWQLDSVVTPAGWIVYMGKFANAEALAKKRGELLFMKLTSQVVTNPELAPGLSLGGFESQAAAMAALGRLGQRGIRTAKVVQEHKEGQDTQLKFPAVTEALRPLLNDIKPALAGHVLSACR